jgi:hypothetical protein
VEQTFADQLAEARRPRPVADLRKDGCSRYALGTDRWRRTSQGLYVPGELPVSPAQRIVEAAALMPPGSTLAGWAAAYAQGVEHLDGLGPRMVPQPVPICLPRSLHRPSVPGVRYVRQVLTEAEQVDVAGLSFTSPLRTALDLACWASDLTEAVVALDVLLQAGLVSSAGLGQASARLDGRRGARQARAAVALTRPGARSPGETRLRVLYVQGLGVPTPLINPEVTDLSGRLLGLPDLLDPEAGLVLEYDGARWAGTERDAGHRDPEQHREDNLREERFERTALRVVRADGADVSSYPTLLTRRMAAARAEGLARDRGQDRWRVRPPRVVAPD